MVVLDRGFRLPFTTNYDEKNGYVFYPGDEGQGYSAFPSSTFDCFWMKEFHLCDFAWDEKLFPEPEAMLRRYHGMGLHICVWMNPYIAQHTALFEGRAEKRLSFNARMGWARPGEYGMGLVDLQIRSFSLVPEMAPDGYGC